MAETEHPHPASSVCIFMKNDRIDILGLGRPETSQGAGFSAVTASVLSWELCIVDLQDDDFAVVAMLTMQDEAAKGLVLRIICGSFAIITNSYGLGPRTHSPKTQNGQGY